MHIGVFDSGIGGEAVAQALKKAFPTDTVTAVSDTAHLPYGDKSKDEIRLLTDAAIQPLLHSPCDIIVIACNSATSAAIEWLRQTYTSQLFIGIEPMIASAAATTKTGNIGVCATPATLKSDRYANLKTTYAQGISILEPDCSNWAMLIESNKMNRTIIQNVLDDFVAHDVDVIVLGCTHYHWIKNDILELVGEKIAVLEPSESIVRRVRQLLAV